jgi:hypothetical protein
VTTPRPPAAAVVEAIADERPVDWLPAERALGQDSPELAGLRLLDDVARAFRQSADAQAAAPAAPALFRWGPLDVREAIGDGLTGEVFRAWDPQLQREVALKLRAQRDPLSDPGNSQLLAEARLLARIRHRNVLAVYGAARHDGRAGIWSELIEGSTLAAVIEHGGPMGPGEALAIAIDLCRALGVVHGAGLVHGDVKAGNVMRERGGRIVLMDFGASGRPNDLDGRLLISGTRRYLAPELLDGRSGPTVASDLYALAVLLYHLLSAGFPRADDGSVAALASRRPDLPAALCAGIDALLVEDPRQRPASAAAMATRLIALQPDTPPRAAVRPWRMLALAGVVAAAVAVAIGLLARPAAVPWQASVAFVDADTGAAIVDGSTVALGDALHLAVRASAPSHVYVINQDSDGALAVLFPLAGLDLANPLPGGRDLVLPGSIEGRRLAWEIASPADSEEFVVIASPQPLPRLQSRLRERPAAAIAPAGGERGAGRLRAGPVEPQIQAAALSELVALAQQDQPDPSRLQVLVVRLPHAPP